MAGRMERGGKCYAAGLSISPGGRRQRLVLDKRMYEERKEEPARKGEEQSRRQLLVEDCQSNSEPEAQAVWDKGMAS